jgi:DNA-binding response OmpR family regulator
VARVLVVDDDLRIRRFVTQLLAEAGLVVEGAANGAEALIALAATPPDVMVLDLQMPVMDGWEFMRQIRASGDETPVLLLSAYGAQRARKELGANDALSKPFDIDELLEHVVALIPPNA